MNAEEFNRLLAGIGWPPRVLAGKLGMGSDRATRRWANGQNLVPDAVARWLRAVAAALEALPPPEDWRAADTGKGERDD